MLIKFKSRIRERESGQKRKQWEFKPLQAQEFEFTTTDDETQVRHVRVIIISQHIKMILVCLPQHIAQLMHLFGFAKATVVKKIIYPCFIHLIHLHPPSPTSTISALEFAFMSSVPVPHSKLFIPLERDCYYGNCSNKNKNPLVDFDFTEIHKFVNRLAKVKPYFLFNINLFVTTQLQTPPPKKQLHIIAPMLSVNTPPPRPALGSTRQIRINQSGQVHHSCQLCSHFLWDVFSPLHSDI